MYSAPARRPGGDGEVAEWLKAHAWKACLRETVTRVRIPPSPPHSPLPAYPVLKDANGFSLAYIYQREGPGIYNNYFTDEEAFVMTNTIARLPE